MYFSVSETILDARVEPEGSPNSDFHAWNWAPKCESEVAQLCLTLCNPMDCSPPGSFIYGIFQARVLEWGAIAFSKLLNVKPSNKWQYIMAQYNAQYNDSIYKWLNIMLTFLWKHFTNMLLIYWGNLVEEAFV